LPKRYPPEFRRRVLELLKAGGSVVEVAADLGVSPRWFTTGVARRRSIVVFDPV